MLRKVRKSLCCGVRGGVLKGDQGLVCRKTKRFPCQVGTKGLTNSLGSFQQLHRAGGVGTKFVIATQEVSG